MMGQLLKVLLGARVGGGSFVMSCMHAAVTLIQIEAVSSPIAI